jgi:hypothetical protein
MSDGFVKVQPDSTGKIIDTTELTVGANTVERQRINIAGLTAAAILDLLTSAPVGTEYAVPVRNIPSGTQAISHANLDAALSTLAKDATLTGGTAKGIVRGGAKGTTTAADVTSTASGANHNVLDAALYDGSGNLIDPRTRSWTLASGTDAVLAAQGTPASLGNAWPVKLTDGAGVNTPSVKAASTAAAAADPSLVVALSPNSPLPAGTSIIGSVKLSDGTDVLLITAAGAAQVDLFSVSGTGIVTSIAGAPGIGGDTADGAADAGKSVKIGGKVTLNNAALPTALTANQRGPAMIDEYGRLRVIQNRPKLLGGYKFESGRQTVLAAAHAATAGFFWLINPVGSSVVCYIKKLFATSVPTAVTAFASSPRITVERVTFTGTASGATITPAKRDSTDAANTCTVRTASTGLTLTAGAIIADFTVPAVLTAVGIAVPVDQWFYDAGDDDDYIVLRAGEGIVVRQADAGTASDTRLLLVFGAWEER